LAKDKINLPIIGLAGPDCFNSMRALVKIIYALSILLLAAYLALPSAEFPAPPPNSLLSQEPADTESVYRRAYYTNYSREEIMNHYKSVFNIAMLQIRLNYPPEEAYTLIRDQTRSSWLEELVHPGRESLFVNGFYPTKPTEQININGVHYINKITVHLFPSRFPSRFTVLGLLIVSFYWLKKEYAKI